MTASPPRLKFSVVGINHSHIYGMVDAIVRGGGELASVHAKEPELLAEFTARYPHARVERDERAVLEDPSVSLFSPRSSRISARRSEFE